MIIGMPKGYVYYRYRPFITAFAEEIGVELKYVDEINQDIIDRGSRLCADEACLPVKVMRGQIDKLSEECRYVCVPRIMKTEFGETLCPKICGMPDMAASDKLVFNEAVCINDRKQLHKYLKRQLKKMKIKRRGLAKAIDKASKAQRGYRYSDDEGYEYNVFIAAHEYNLNNTYSNMNLADRLHRMGIGVIQGRDISRYEKITRIEKLHLIKRPYWDALTDILARAVILSEQKTVDAVICMSSFNCGIDSILTALIYKYVTDIPVFNLKIDEHRADAGFETRLEAFGDIVREAAI